MSRFAYVRCEIIIFDVIFVYFETRDGKKNIEIYNVNELYIKHIDLILPLTLITLYFILNIVLLIFVLLFDFFLNKDTEEIIFGFFNAPQVSFDCTRIKI